MKHFYRKALALCAATIMFALISCNKSEDSDSDSLLLGGIRPVESDRPIPYTYNDWMIGLRDNLYLSEITIPGTHDTGADLHTSQQVSPAPEPQVVAQDFRFSNQLQMGARWFDIRLNLDPDDCTLKLNHGPFYLHKTFSHNILDVAISFLNSHPSEVVILMIKQEHSSACDISFGANVWSAIDSRGISHFYMENRIPRIGEVRGKIVIVRRFSNGTGHPFGMEMSWPDNTTGSNTNSGGIEAFVQDHYSMLTVTNETKIEEIKACARLAHNEGIKTKFYLNFTSGERDIAPLKNITKYINPAINTWLLTPPIYHNVGIMMLNFAGGSDDGEVESQLLRTLVTLNDLSFRPITIGNQLWQGSNLFVTTYRNGDPIPRVTDPTAWANLTTGAYCDVNGSSDNGFAYGYLYNWYAVTDPRGLAPEGWRIPTQGTWDTLCTTLGGRLGGAVHLIERGTTHWISPNTNAQNETGFSARGSGFRDNTGRFDWFGDGCFMWTSTDDNSRGVYNAVFRTNWDIEHGTLPHKTGCALRLVKE